jgi:hypothetical protein
LCGRKNTFDSNSVSLSPGGCNIACRSASSEVCGGISSLTMYNNLIPLVPQPLFMTQNDSPVAKLFTGLSSTSPQALLSSQINLIQNPYLSENAAIACPQGQLCVSSNKAGISPWYLTSGSEYQLDRTSWANYDKSAFSMDLSAWTQYTLGQNVSTIVGLPYIVTYMISINPGCGERVKLGFIRATGAPQSNFSQYTTAWTAYNYTFIASSNITVLEIGSIATSPCGPVLGCMFFMISLIIHILILIVDVNMVHGVTYTNCYNDNSAFVAFYRINNGSLHSVTSCIAACLAISPIYYWYGVGNG